MISLERIKEICPEDKSWVIRMGILDLTRGHKSDLDNYLANLPKDKVSGDLKALGRVSRDWNERYQKPLEVGESGTIYRFVKMYNWRNGIEHDPIVSGTLIDRSKRDMANNPEIAKWTMNQLRELDHKTTQWATMKYLLDSPGERKEATPVVYHGKRITRDGDFKLRVTYDAGDHWEDKQSRGETWQTRTDPTFVAQLHAFAKSLETGKMEFTGEQAEDFCFERAFDLIDESEGRLVYPTVEGHETDRFTEMERALKIVDLTERIDSRDHRVVQAMVMRQIFLGKHYHAVHMDAPNKTWPGFWNAIDEVLKNHL